MILLLGCTLALGAMLSVSPWLWRDVPRNGTSAKPSQGFRPARLLRDRMKLAGAGSVPVTAFVAVSIMLGFATGAVIFAVVPVVPLAIAAGASATALPTLVIGWRARSLRQVRRASWPDAVDHLVSATRSGVALPDGVSALAHIGPADTRAAFAAFAAEYEASGNFGRCLDRVKDRLADPTADRILETLRMSREVGGTELPSVLRALAAHLRQEAAIRGEVEARQSWVMNAARLGAVAPWVILALLSTRPEAAAAYNSAGGVAIIVGGLIATIVAYRVMVALARLPEERRWFQ